MQFVYMLTLHFYAAQSFGNFISVTLLVWLILIFLFFLLQSKSYSKQILRIVNLVGYSVDYTKELYEKPSVLKTKSLSMVLDRQVPSRIGNKALEYQGSKVTLPATQELIGRDGENKQYLSTQVRLFLYM